MDWTDVEKGISSQIFAIFDDFSKFLSNFVIDILKNVAKNLEGKKWRVYETWILGNQLVTRSTRVHLDFMNSDIEFENF